MGKRKGIRAVIITLSLLVVLAVLFILYTSDYYHASPDVESYCLPGTSVTVSDTPTGLLFDGEGEENALIFYPGGKVEYTAYIPLLSKIAERGVDVFLVKMPFNLAFFGKNRADDIISSYDYSHWYISGHSLGGVVAAYYALGNSDKLDGIIFLASYTATDLKSTDLRVLTLYGSEDGVLSPDDITSGRSLLPEGSKELVIEGGNHAQFGLYGKQKGDGEAAITSEDQWNITAEAVTSFIL